MPDGKYHGIYCHSDGYLDWNGRILLKHYRDPAKVAQLVALGDLSSISEQGEPTAYHRDRGEHYDDVAPQVDATATAVADRLDHDGYVYVFEDGAWTVNGQPLQDALTNKDASILRFNRKGLRP
jgi:hypothetical protein